MTRIMVVDDDELFAHMLAERLRRDLGDEAEVVSVFSGEDALRLAESAPTPLDILLVDHRLGPGMDGLATMQEMQRRSPGINAVLFTGDEDSETGLRAYEAGAFRYLLKPFQPAELVWIVRSLIQQRGVNYERNWLRLLNDIGEATQRVTSLRDAAQALVDGGKQLGFARARIFRIADSDAAQPMLEGVAELGHEEIPGFVGRRWPLAEAIYAQKAWLEQTAQYFHGDEFGAGVLIDPQSGARFPVAAGEWVIAPLVDDGKRCVGVIVLDHGPRQGELPPDLRRLLHLFFRLASAAFGRAVHEERQRVRTQASEIVQRAQARATAGAEGGRLNALLTALHNELRLAMPFENFIVVLRATGSEWFHYTLHIERGVQQSARWIDARNSGLISHVVDLPTPLFLPRDVKRYREEKEIKQIGARHAESFIGVQLRTGDETFGALIVEHDATPDIFTREHLELLKTIAVEIAGLVRVAWLNEREEELTRPLKRLQQASYALMTLADKADDSFQGLWDAACVLATAPYGFGFDRAMLFLAEEGGQRLRGVAGVGCFHQDSAERKQSLSQMFGESFEEFIERHPGGEIGETEIGNAVQKMLIALSPGDDACAAVLRSGRYQKVAGDQAQSRLPKEFVDKFGVTSYHVVPLQSVGRTIGLLFVNRRQGSGPDNDELIPHLNALSNQAAVIYENWRNDRAQKRLIAMTQRVLAVGEQMPPLKETLGSICEVAKEVLNADLVAVLPLKEGSGQLFDVDNAAILGFDNDERFRKEYHAEGLTEHVLARSDPLTIPDVAKDEQLYAGKRLAEREFFIEERIRALVAAPIMGVRTNRPRGVLYIDYRSPQHFAEWEIRLADALARLAGVAIHNWRKAQGQLHATESREKELELLGEVLQEALTYGEGEAKKRAVIYAILQRATELMAPLPVRVGLLLLDWQEQADTHGGTPIQVRRQYQLATDGSMSDSTVEHKPSRGISGRALTSGKTQHAPDVHALRWEGIYHEQEIGTQSEVDVPIKVGDQVMGVLNVESTQADGFEKPHIAMLERFAATAALALNNVERQRHLNAVLVAASTVTAPSGLEATLQAIVNAIQTALPDVSTLTVWYKDPLSDELQLGPYFGVSNEAALKAEDPKQSRTIQDTAARAKPLFADNVAEHPELGTDFVNREGITSTAAFPLNANDESMGAMFFSYRHPHSFSPEEKSLFETLAQIVAAAVKEARLLEEAQMERRRFGLTLDVANAVGAALELEETVERILRRLQDEKIFPDTTPAILLYNGEEHQLEFTPSSLKFYTPDNPEFAKLTSIPVAEHSIAGALALKSLANEKKEIINIPDVRFEANYMPVRQTTRSQMSVTLYSEVRGLMGVLMLESDKPNAFDRDAEELASLVADQIRLAVERTRQREELEFNETLAAASAWSREIAHDINQEIFEIRSWAEALRDAKDDIQRGNAFQKVDSAAARMAGANLPERQRPEMVVLDETLGRQIAQIIAEQDSAIRLELAGLQCGLQEVETYPFALERIFRHLVRNSRQALQRTGALGEKRIRVATRPISGDMVEIEYSDNGPGFPFHLRSRVFRTRLPSEQDPQRGVGLLLVRFIVEQMGGSIRLATAAEGEGERGARFVIRLPCKQANTNRGEVKAQ